MTRQRIVMKDNGKKAAPGRDARKRVRQGATRRVGGGMGTPRCGLWLLLATVSGLGPMGSGGRVDLEETLHIGG